MVENLLRLMTETIKVIRHWLGLFVKGKVMKCSKNGLKSLGGETAILAQGLLLLTIIMHLWRNGTMLREG